MQALKRRKKEYPLYNPTTRVLKKRSLSLVVKKSIIPEIVDEIIPKYILDSASLASIPALRQQFEQQRLIQKHFKKHPLVNIPDGLIAPSPFQIVKRNEMASDYLEKPSRIEYGKSWIEQTGRKLYPQDKTVLLVLLKLRDYYNSNIFYTSILEICQHLGSSNPSSSSVQESVKNSLRRLMGANLETEIWDEKEGKRIRWFMFHILGNTDLDAPSQKLTIVIDPYFTEMDKLKKLTSLNSVYRQLIPGDIATGIYDFLQRQQSFYKWPYIYPWFNKRGGPGKGARFEKFCYNIGYRSPLPLWQKRQGVKKALETHVFMGYIKTWSLIDDYLIIYKVPSISKGASKDDYPKITRTFRNMFLKRWNGWDWEAGWLKDIDTTGQEIEINEDDEKSFVIAAKRYMEEVLPDWKKYDVSIAKRIYLKPELGVEKVFMAIEHGLNPVYTPKAYWLCSDKTIKEKIPKHLGYEVSI